MCRGCFVIFFALCLSRGVFGGQLTLSSFTTRAEVTPLTKRQMSSHEKEASATDIDPDLLCIKTTVLSIEDPAASKTGSMKGWMTQEDWGAELHKIDAEAYPVLRIGVDGFPCAAHGCCQHNMSIRLGGSDWFVLQHVINELATFLKKLMPWRPKTILEGGGNIGVATILLAFMYPNAKIIALEPEPENCRLLKANTANFGNVEVMCVGLWDKADAAVRLVEGGDGFPWSWRLEEVAKGSPGALQTVSAPELIKKHGLHGFDMVKLDVEGAEFGIFGEAADKAWLDQTQVLSLEVHGGYGDQMAVRRSIGMLGFTSSSSGEYDVFSRPHLYPRLKQWRP